MNRSWTAGVCCSLSFLTLLASCSPVPFPERPSKKVLERLEKLSTAPKPEPGNNWPLPPGLLAQVLSEGDLEIREAKPIGTGVTKPYRFTAYAPTFQKEIKFKWKAVPEGTADDVNNSPRKEIVADLIQRWFLDPEDYVVPPSVVRCFPLDKYREFEKGAEPNIPGTRCVLGNASVWMENVTFPKEGWIPAPFCTPIIYDEERFLNDPNYAYHLSNLNLLTYLIKHMDGRCGNFMVSEDASNQRIFSIDNGISFDNFWYRNYGTANWESIWLPALRKQAIERLRKLTRKDLESLGVAVEMRADENGILRLVRHGENMDPSRGARVAPGRVQFGLTDSEIDGLENRLKKLLEQIDNGNLAVF